MHSLCASFSLFMHMTHSKNAAMNTRDWLAAGLIAAIWGLNFSFIKLGVAHIDPLVLAALRFALCALPGVFLLPRPQLAWRWVLGYGLLFGVGTWAMVTLALRTGLSPGLAAWLLQSSAFITPLLAVLLLKERMLDRQRWGAGIALLGFGLVLWHTAGQASALGLLAMGVAALSLSLANVLVRRSGVKQMLSLMVWSSLVAPLPLLALACGLQGPQVLTDLPMQLQQPWAASSLAFQVYPTTLFGYWVWNTLIARHGAGTVAPVALLVPVFATGFTALIFGVWPSLGQALGIGGIALGLAVSAGLMAWPRRQPSVAQAPRS